MSAEKNLALYSRNNVFEKPLVEVKSQTIAYTSYTETAAIVNSKSVFPLTKYTREHPSEDHARSSPFSAKLTDAALREKHSPSVSSFTK